jgi:ABC-type cobalamin transport system permease subunit
MKRAILLLLIVAIAGVIWWVERPRPQTLVLTGTVDRNEVVVGSKITGRIVVFAHNLAKLNLARALGNVIERLPSLLQYETSPFR